MKKAVYLILSTLTTFTSVAQNIPPDTISNRLWLQSCLFPNEKIHVHTDRSVYAGSDTIWFKRRTDMVHFSIVLHRPYQLPIVRNTFHDNRKRSFTITSVKLQRGLSQFVRMNSGIPVESGT